MFVVFGLIPIMDAAVAKYVDDRWRSRVYAVSYVVSFGIGPAAIPLIAALHGESGGFPYLFFVLALIAVGTLAAGLVLPRDPMRRPDAAAGAT
jgi:MFS family permease